MPTHTLQSLQTNIGSLMDDMDAGLITSVDVIKEAGGDVVAKLLKYSTYVAAAVANTTENENIAQTLLQSGPMSPASDGLYKLVKVAADSAAVPDSTIHAFLQHTTGAGGVLFTAVNSGEEGELISVEFVDPGVDGAISVGVVGTAITVTLAYALGAVTSTMAQIAAAIAASSAASALVTATATGVTTTIAAAMALTLLAGAGAMASTSQKFKIYSIYRKRQHSRNANVAPSLSPRAVLISQTHAEFLDLP
jgi:hypothetical protein